MSKIIDNEKKNSERRKNSLYILPEHNKTIFDFLSKKRNNEIPSLLLPQYQNEVKPITIILKKDSLQDKENSSTSSFYRNMLIKTQMMYEKIKTEIAENIISPLSPKIVSVSQENNHSRSSKNSKIISQNITNQIIKTKMTYRKNLTNLFLSKETSTQKGMSFKQKSMFDYFRK